MASLVEPDTGPRTHPTGRRENTMTHWPEITREEALDVFKKYDPPLFELYTKRAYLLGASAYRYAIYLKNKNEGRTP